MKKLIHKIKMFFNRIFRRSILPEVHEDIINFNDSHFPNIEPHTSAIVPGGMSSEEVLRYVQSGEWLGDWDDDEEWGLGK